MAARSRVLAGLIWSVLISLSSPAAQYTLTVHDYPTGDGPANLVSNGIPLKPGELSDARNIRVLDGTTELPVAARVLARWHTDNSIRSVLVQFDAPFTGATKNFTVDVGNARGTTDRAAVAVTWRYPRKIATLSAAQLCTSLICWEQKPLGQSGFPAWDQKQRDSFSRINTEPDPTVTCSRYDQYYDTISTSYQLYVRTGELQYLTNARRWAVHHRRDQIYLSGPNAGHPIIGGGYFNNTRYTFVDGLVRDYMFWGDDESLRVAGIVCDSFYAPHADSWYYKAPNTRGFWTEREAAFAQLGLVAYFEATGNSTYLTLARNRFHSLHRMQVDNGNRAWIHNLYDHDPSEGCPPTAWGSSPFMSGLLMESLIRYHKLTADPVARESILFAVDYLRSHDVATGAYAGRGFIYLGDPNTYQDGNPDIDNLITHAYGYAYRLSNFTRTDYLNFGRDVFNNAVTNGFTGASKQYNQAFRSSGHFVAYIDPAVQGLPQPGNTAPTITSHPANRSVTAGQTATFSVTATGTAPLAYQWQRNGTNISGATSASYTTPATTLSDNGATFRCVVSNSAGSATSNSATLTVTSPPTAPTITSHPANRSVTAGQTATFSVTATGTAPLAYQWQRNGTNISGATSASYTTPTTTLSDNGATFRCVVSNSAGTATSNSATLTVTSPPTAPTITSHPANRSVTAGQTATFSVTATGTAPLAYQWQRNGANISGATSASYTTPATTLSDDGATFRCVVSNSAGSATSNSGTLTVSAVNQAPVANSQTVSTRKNTSVSIRLTATDPEGAALTYVVVTQPSRGTLTGAAPNLTYTPAQRFSGTDSFTFRANDGSLNSNVATVTINVTRSAPTLTSAVSAQPNPSKVGETVAFSAAASDAENDALTYRWNYGDGSEDASSGQHAYATAGQYVATLTVTDEDGLSVSSSTTVTVSSNTGGGGNGGGVSPPGTDTDGDGVWDEHEIADGTDPRNPESLQRTAMPLKALSGSVSFKSANRDACSIAGTLPVLLSGSIEGTTVLLDVGGAKLKFVLNAKGSARNEFGTLMLKLPKTPRSNLPFTVKIKNGAWAAVWSDEGVQNETVAGKPMTLGIDVILMGRLYHADASVLYSAKQGGAGKFKAR